MRRGACSRIARLACCGLALSLAAAASAGAAVVDFALGWQRFEGEFEGGDEITLEQIPLEIEINRRGGRLTIVVPQYRIEGTGTVTMSMDGPMLIGAGGPGAPSHQRSRPGGSESGLGDIILREESYLVRGGEGRRPFVSWILDLKIPTADEKEGLGTGERDWGVGFKYVQPLGRVFQILGDVSYRFMGDPGSIDIDDRVRLMAGFAFVTSGSRWRVVVENVTPAVDMVPVYDTAGTPIGLLEADDYRVARLDLLVRSQRGGTTRFTVTKGLTDSAEDLGFAIRFSSGGG